MKFTNFVNFSLPLSPSRNFLLLSLSFLVIGKRKFDGLGQSQGDPKRRFGIGNGGNGNWGSQPLPQQPLGNGAEQWYTDTYPTWS